MQVRTGKPTPTYLRDFRDTRMTILKESGGYSSTLNTFYIPKWGWDKPFMVVFQGKLRQAMFLKASIELTDEKYYKAVIVYEMKIAGIGIVQVLSQSKDKGFSSKCYESLADYKNGNAMDTSLMNHNRIPPMEYFSKAMGEKFATMRPEQYDNNRSEFVRWYWSGTSAHCKKFYYPSRVYYDKTNGFYLDIDYTFPEGTYATQAECVADNEVQVEYFDGFGGEFEEEDKKNIVIMGIVYKMGENDVDNLMSFLSGIVSSNNEEE